MLLALHPALSISGILKDPNINLRVGRSRDPFLVLDKFAFSSKVFIIHKTWWIKSFVVMQFVHVTAWF